MLDRRVRRLVGRGRLPEVRPDDQLHRRRAAAGVRDFPAQMGPRRGRRLHRRGEVRRRLAAADVGRPHQTLYYQVGIGEGNDQDGRRPRHLAAAPGRRHATAGTSSAVPLHPPPAGLPRRPAGVAHQPQPGRPRRGGLRARATRSSRRSDPAFAGKCLLAAEHIFELAEHGPAGNLLTVIPYSFYPETEWRDDLELGATELYSAVAAGDAAGRPAAHRPALLPAAGRALGATPTSRARTTPRTPSTSTTSAAWPTTSSTAPSRRPADPSGLAVTTRPLLADLKKQLDKAVAQAADGPVPASGSPGDLGHDHARGRPRRHGQRVRPADRHDRPTPTGAPLAGNILGANAWGVVVHRRRRQHVPALPAAPGGQPQSARSTEAAGPAWALRGRAEQRPGQRHRAGHAPAGRGPTPSSSSTGTARNGATTCSTTPTPNRRST